MEQGRLLLSTASTRLSQHQALQAVTHPAAVGALSCQKHRGSHWRCPKSAPPGKAQAGRQSHPNVVNELIHESCCRTKGAQTAQGHIMFAVCFATLTFPQVPVARAGGKQGVVTASREWWQRAAFGVSNISSHLTQCPPVQQHWEETAGLGRFESLCSFLEGTDPTPGLPNQSRWSPKQAQISWTQGFHCQVTWAPLPKDRRRAVGANTGFKTPFFQSKMSNSSCPGESLITSPSVLQDLGAIPVGAQQV